MNAQEFAPDNNSAGKLNKSQIIDGFLFITDQQFTKTVEKRVRDLNAPTAGPEVRVAFQFLLFLAASMFAGILYPLLDEVPQYDTGYLPTV